MNAAGAEGKDSLGEFWRWAAVVLTAGWVLIYIFLSIFHSRVICSGLVSLLLAPVAFLARAGSIDYLWNTALLDYRWAAAVWLCSGIFIVACATGAAVRWKWTQAFLQFIGGKKAGEREGAVLSFGVCAAAGFLLLAAAAPFVAPFDPNAQGDLATTRELRPLSNGIAWEISRAVREAPAGEAVLVRALRDADEYLLHRHVRFTRPGSIEYETMLHGEAGLRAHRVVFLFGTDAVGRDLLSRVVYGTRVSLGVGAAAVLVSLLIGCIVGFLAGAFSGFVDRVLMSGVDLALSIPSLFLAVTLVAFLGRSSLTTVVVLAVTGWMAIARLVRGEVMKVREQEFVLAARLLGVSQGRIIVAHFMPNVLPVVLTASVLQLGNAVLGEAALSFLGLGIQPPTPSWGNIIGEGMTSLGSAPWIGIFPGVAVSVLALVSHLIVESSQEIAARG